jgi:hypothetical protein
LPLEIALMPSISKFVVNGRELEQHLFIQGVNRELKQGPTQATVKRVTAVGAIASHRQLPFWVGVFGHKSHLPPPLYPSLTPIPSSELLQSEINSFQLDHHNIFHLVVNQ